MRLTNCAVAGFPASHSLSPVIHREAYRLLGLDGWRYGVADLPPEEYVGFVESRDASWRGLSVTMPHKEATALLGEPDADVALTGVANTLVWHDGGRRACHNTDIAGFVAALAGSSWTPSAATVLGAGATARSALAALARLGCATVEVKARSRDKAEQFVDWAAEALGPASAVRVRVGEWLAPQDDPAALVVSTLPHAAAAPLAESLRFAAGAMVFDVSYDPWPTPLAAAALARGIPVLDGIDLLVHQAVEQVRLMTGHTTDAAPLLSAARAELTRRAGA